MKTSRNPRLLDWQQRLAKVEQRLATDIEANWIDHVRAKILRYFIARYGHEPGSLSSAPQGLVEPDPQRPSIQTAGRQRSSPPLTGTAMRHLLLDIHERVQRATYRRTD
ncbi:MAG: hypothetical protein R3C18_06115 [Planctomycetaceae bacterium]